MSVRGASSSSAGAVFDVLVAGELNVDIIVTGDDLAPRWGQERLVEDVTLAPGSSSAICASQMAKLGLRTAFVGKVGPDSFGRFMLDALSSAGVDASHVITDPRLRTGATVSLSTPRERALLTHLGAIEALESRNVAPLLRRARHLHVSAFFLQTHLRLGLASLFASARATGMSTSLDTGWDPAEEWDGGLRDVLAQTDVFLPNEVEACAISRCSDVTAALTVLQQLTPMGAVKLSAAGAIGWEGDQVVRQPAYPVRVVDTTGAGDNFNAGFLSGRLTDSDLAECLRWGCACAALSVTQPGGFTAQPVREQLDAFLAHQVE